MNFKLLCETSAQDDLGESPSRMVLVTVDDAFRARVRKAAEVLKYDELKAIEAQEISLQDWESDWYEPEGFYEIQGDLTALVGEGLIGDSVYGLRMDAEVGPYMIDADQDLCRIEVYDGYFHALSKLCGCSTEYRTAAIPLSVLDLDSVDQVLPPVEEAA